jgi:endonuclease/exonuclease/phosphatase (EEP) superfamily protein YafD
MTIRQILSVAICVIVSLVLFAIATRYVHPHWMLAALHSLQLHFALACAVAMLVAILLHRNIVSYLLLIAALVLAGHAVLMVRQLAAEATAADERAPSFRLLSFNILSSNYPNAEAIARMIAASGADVVNVMESEPLWAYLPELASNYPYHIGCGVKVMDCDQLMLSKTPLENGVIRSLGPIFDNRFIIAETVIRGQRINVAGIHTTKPYFDNFQTMELIRAALALTDKEGPLVLSGDFNASTLAPNIREFLRWTDLHTASWEPATWPIELGPFGLAIDHVYVRAPLKFKSLNRLPDAHGSNHAGLVADIVISGN